MTTSIFLLKPLLVRMALLAGNFGLGRSEVNRKLRSESFLKQEESSQPSKVLTFPKPHEGSQEAPSRPDPPTHNDQSIFYLIGWVHNFYDAVHDDGVSWPICRLHFPEPASADEVPPSVLYDRGFRDGGLFRRSQIAPYSVALAKFTPMTNSPEEKVRRKSRSTRGIRRPRTSSKSKKGVSHVV